MRSKLSEHDRKFVLCTGQSLTIDELKKHSDSHIVGELHHLLREDIKVTVCAVYERARTVNDVPIALPSILVYAIGDAIIKCTLCDYKREWEISRTGFFLLMYRAYRGFPARGV